jgi:hypothetical protein
MHTAARRLLTFLALLHLTGGVASAKEVRVEVVFDRPLASQALAFQALKEAAGVWAPYGVTVGPQARDCASVSNVRLGVEFGNAPNRGMASASIGSIRFRDGVPEPAIVLYPYVIAALVSATPPGSFIVNSEGALRDFILGRALGRALAHEIGHFLLRSQQHSAVGLMRAFHPTGDLVDPDRRRFSLAAGDVRRLAAMTSSFATPSSLSCGD